MVQSLFRLIFITKITIKKLEGEAKTKKKKSTYPNIPNYKPKRFKIH